MFCSVWEGEVNRKTIIMLAIVQSVPRILTRIVATYEK